MLNRSLRRGRVGLACAAFALAAGCAPVQRVVDVKGADGPARKVIRIVESVEAHGTTTLSAADETKPEQAVYGSLFDAFAEVFPIGCTATHLGQGVVLTAGHCMTDPPEDKIPRFPRVIDDDQCAANHDGVSETVTMRWGRRFGKSAYLQSVCARAVAWEWNDERDFAVLLIAPSGGKLPRAAVPPELTEPPQNEGITLFSFPLSASLRWSGVCKLGDPTGGPAPYFFHTCSTDGGSSGAAVLDTTSRRVVGFHLGQWGERGPNYAMYLADPEVLGQVRRAFLLAGEREAGAPPPVRAKGPAQRL